jgi:hypothetical protein
VIDADKPRFVAAIEELALVKSNAKLTKEAFRAWWNAICQQGWAIEDFCAACAKLRDESEFMPNPYHFAQLRKRATSLTGGDAWSRAVAHARDLPAIGGHLQEQPSGDAVLDRVARMVGGYKAIANASERDLQFMGQRFLEHFAEVSEGEEAREAMPALAQAAQVLLPEGVAALARAKRLA